jgi:hypothetical protein
LTVPFLRQKRECHRSASISVARLSRVAAACRLPRLGPNRKRNIKLLLGLELARLRALGHNLRVFALKVSFILGVDLFFFPGDDDFFLFFRIAAVVGCLLLSILYRCGQVS